MPKQDVAVQLNPHAQVSPDTEPAIPEPLEILSLCRIEAFDYKKLSHSAKYTLDAYGVGEL